MRCPWGFPAPPRGEGASQITLITRLPRLLRSRQAQLFSAVSSQRGLPSVLICRPIIGSLIRPVPVGGYARLVPRRDAEAMAGELLWVAADPEQALKGREYVVREWDSKKA